MTIGKDLRRQVAAIIVVSSVALLVVGAVVLWDALGSLRETNPDVGAPTVAEIAKSGVFLVGKDMRAGTYFSEDAESGCSWTIYSRGVAVGTGEGSGRVEVTILPHYSSFSTNKCGTWRRTGD